MPPPATSSPPSSSTPSTRRSMRHDDHVTDFPLPNASFDLIGQVALVTGATSGLGWRFSQVLAAAGGTVVPTGRREDRLGELTELITSQGGTAIPLRVDMTDADDIIATIGRAEEAVGAVT